MDTRYDDRSVLQQSSVPEAPACDLSSNSRRLFGRMPLAYLAVAPRSRCARRCWDLSQRPVGRNAQPQEEQVLIAFTGFEGTGFEGLLVDVIKATAIRRQFTSLMPICSATSNYRF